MIAPFRGCPFEAASGKGLSRIEHEHIHLILVSYEKIESLYSVNVDEACRSTYPTSRRWDYGLWYAVRNGRSSERICFVEVHKAETGEVSVVLEKKRWLLDLLAGISLPSQDWFWIPSGRMLIPKTSARYRSLAIKGIRIVRTLEIPDRR